MVIAQSAVFSEHGVRCRMINGARRDMEDSLIPLAVLHQESQALSIQTQFCFEIIPHLTVHGEIQQIVSI